MEKAIVVSAVDALMEIVRDGETSWRFRSTGTPKSRSGSPANTRKSGSEWISTRPKSLPSV